MFAARRALVVGFVSLVLASYAPAQIDVGFNPSLSLGDWNPTADTVVNLAAEGTYDPDRWAVVFHYDSITIPAGVDITFANHPSTAPVVWIVGGDITIDGTVSLNGRTGHGQSSPATFAEPGPGGFRGGRGAFGVGYEETAGFGPGGGYLNLADGSHDGTGGSYGTSGVVGGSGGGPAGVTYNNAAVFQLIGGSGGSGFNSGANGFGQGGGSGGGAILIACSGAMQLGSAGVVQARGGGANLSGGEEGGGGAGGAIRLVSDAFTMPASAVLRADGATGYDGGGRGGDGRIRIETNARTINGSSNPPYSLGAPGAIFPEPGSPTLTLVSIDGIPVTDPRSGIGQGGEQADVSVAFPGPVEVIVETTNIEPSTSTVYLRFWDADGGEGAGGGNSYESVMSPEAGGNVGFSRWSVIVDVSDGYSVMQSRVTIVN